MNHEERIIRLNAKLPEAAIKTRKQGNFELPYIEGHYAKRQANILFDHSWSARVLDKECVQSELLTKTDNYGKSKTLWYVGYTATVAVTAMGEERQDVGFGQGQDADLGRSHESAIKEAVTDALKRALSSFGDQFGLALYDKTQEFVDRTPVVIPQAIPPEASAEEKERNARLYFRRTVYPNLEKPNDKYRADLKRLREGCGDKWAEWFLEAEQEGCTTPEELGVFLLDKAQQSAPKAETAGAGSVNTESNTKPEQPAPVQSTKTSTTTDAEHGYEFTQTEMKQIDKALAAKPSLVKTDVLAEAWRFGLKDARDVVKFIGALLEEPK